MTQTMDMAILGLVFMGFVVVFIGFIVVTLYALRLRLQIWQTKLLFGSFLPGDNEQSEPETGFALVKFMFRAMIIIFILLLFISLIA